MIKTTAGKEVSVYNRLKQMLDKSALIDLVFGQYDIVLRLSAKDNDELAKIVLNKVRGGPDVEGTMTLLVAENIKGTIPSKNEK